jgi:hypothetical protein
MAIVQQLGIKICSGALVTSRQLNKFPDGVQRLVASATVGPALLMHMH